MVIDKDKGYAAALAALTNTIPALYTGVFGEAAERVHYPNRGKTVGDVAVEQEFGTPTSPARSFVRDYWDEAEDEVRRLLAVDLDGQEISKVDWDATLNKLGDHVDAAMKIFMRTRPPGLAPITIARKGHDETLIDTHQLEQAIGHKVVL